MSNASKGNKYIIALVIGLVLMFLGGSLLIYYAYIPYRIGTGESFKVFYVDLAEFSKGNINFPNSTYINFSYCFLQFISYAPILVLIFWLFSKEFIDDFKRFKEDIWKNLGVIGLCYVGMIILNAIVSRIYDIIGIGGESNNEETITLLLNGDGKLLMIVSVVLMAPICEEFIFRKFIFGVVEERFHWKAFIAVIASALVFSFIHVSDLPSLKFIFQYIALAVPICLCYHFTNNNVVASIIIHVWNNTISVIATYFLIYGIR